MKKNGFTLIELLIVVAILGILAAVAAPHLLGVKRPSATATNAQCVQGILFVTDSNGNTKPATDSVGNSVKCGG